MLTLLFLMTAAFGYGAMVFVGSKAGWEEVTRVVQARPRVFPPLARSPHSARRRAVTISVEGGTERLWPSPSIVTLY